MSLVTDTPITQPGHGGHLVDVPGQPPSGPANRFWSDSATMTRRNLLRLWRTPQIIAFTFVGPIVFLILFDTVFGGSVPTGELDYIDFLVPGVLIQTAVFDGVNTATGITEDIQRGSLDRFLSLPSRRASIVVGRTTTDLARAVATSIVVVVVGGLLGFRPTEGPLGLLGGVALALAFGHTFHWAYAYFGLKLKDPAVVQSAAWLPVFPLVFAASTFAPVENMPGWMKPFSEHQPVTVTVDAIRALVHGGELAGPLTQALCWIVGLLSLWTILSSRAIARGVR